MFLLQSRGLGRKIDSYFLVESGPHLIVGLTSDADRWVGTNESVPIIVNFFESLPIQPFLCPTPPFTSDRIRQGGMGALLLAAIPSAITGWKNVSRGEGIA